MSLESVTLQEQYALLMPRAWFLNTKISINRNQGSLEKGAGGGKSTEWAWNILNQKGRKGLKMNDGDMTKKKNAGASFKRVPIAKFKTIWAAERIMAVKDHSTRNSWLHSDTQNKKKNKSS